MDLSHFTRTIIPPGVPRCRPRCVAVGLLTVWLYGDGEPGPTYLCPVLVFLRLEMGQQSVTMVHSRAPPLLVITPDQARPGQASSNTELPSEKLSLQSYCQNGNISFENFSARALIMTSKYFVHFLNKEMYVCRCDCCSL